MAAGESLWTKETKTPLFMCWTLKPTLPSAPLQPITILIPCFTSALIIPILLWPVTGATNCCDAGG